MTILKPQALLACVSLISLGGCDSWSTGEGPSTQLDDRLKSETAPGTPDLPAKVVGELHSQFGFSLDPPRGWEAEQATQPVHFAARWLPKNQPDTDISQFTVQVTPTTVVSFDQLVSNTKVPTGYDSERIKLDGVDALEIRHPKMAGLVGGEKPLLGPVVLAMHDGREYRIAFLLDSRDEIVAARNVLKSWRWQPTTPAIDLLQLGSSQAILGGKAKMKVPKSARQDLSMVTPSTDSYIVYDYAGKQDAIVMGAEWIESPDSTLSQQTFDYAEQIEQNTRLNALLNFSPLSDAPHVMVSEPIVGEFPGEIGPVRRTSRYAVWQVEPGKFVHLQFVINDEMLRDESDHAAANEAIQEMLGSCDVTR